MPRIALLLASTSLFAGAPALAQTAAPATVTPSAVVAPDTQATTPGATASATPPGTGAPGTATPGTEATASDTTGNTSALGDIIVTAQRRSENIQKAPIAIDAISPVALQRANITEADGISQLVPSAHFGKASGPYTLFYIRGVGINATSSVVDSAISLALDGVPLARQYDTVGQFYDLERVEVLEGPQGTLYGRNATGGAVNIIPNHPRSEFGATANLTVGDYDTILADAALNLPINDVLSTRFSFASASHDGYNSDGGNDEDVKSARAQILYKPTGHLSILLAGDLAKQRGQGGGFAIDSNGFAYTQRIGNTDPAVQAIETSRKLQVVKPTDLFLDNNFWGLKAEINWDSELGTLTVLPAYRHGDLNYVAMNGAENLLQEHDNQESVEARFATRDFGPFKAIIGGYYMNDAINTNLTVNQLTGAGNQQIYTYSTDTKAVFGDATYKLTDTLRLLGGIRYTTETKALNGSLHNPFAVNPTYIRINSATTNTAVTYRAGAQFDVLPESMLYATVASGFHSGGYFFTVDNPVFKPEHITAYTVGIKNRFADNRVQLNIELFQWNYSDQQVSHTANDSGNNVVFVTQNAGRTRIQGVEASMQDQIFSHTQIGMGIQYLHSKFLEYSYIQPSAGSALSLCSSTRVATGFQINCAGQTPPNSPRWILTPSVDQIVPINDDYSIDLNATGHYETASYTTVTYQPTDRQPRYFTGNLSATLNIHDKWSVGVFVNNVADSVIKEFTTHTNFNQSFLQPPRTYGFRIGAKFN